MALTLILILLPPAVLSWPLGRVLATLMHPEAPPVGLHVSAERLIARLGGARAAHDQDWRQYIRSLLVFNLCMGLVAAVVLALQSVLPLNPDGRGPLHASLIFHTVASFVTNTNQQHYAGEAQLSHFSQLGALMWMQFVSAATGLAALTALARALAGSTRTGNFHRDVLRATLLVLLPGALLLSLVLVLTGVPMTLAGAVDARTLEGVVQHIARGPVAAFVGIKQIGTNGGGFFGANAAHPFENPSTLSTLIECSAMLLLPMASVWMFGRITRAMRHAAVVWSVMAVLLVSLTVASTVLEQALPTAMHDVPVTPAANFEGKELRCGAAATGAWVAVTTATSNGSVTGMHDSVAPLTGLVALAGMWMNVAFGGVGVGMITMFIYIIIGVFISGMMVGRTPEYLHRRVEAREMALAVIALLLHPLLILSGSALYAATPLGGPSALSTGAHDFSRILYECTSAAANNGSGMEGLQDATAAWNVGMGIVMLLGRFVPIVLPLAIAGRMAAKKSISDSVGTLRTDTPLFGIVLVGMVMFIGALLFLPVAVLGPIAEHLSALP